MRAALCRAYGPPDVVGVDDDVAEPAAGPGQVLVDVHAAAVNFPDVLVVADAYQVSAPLPFIPGSELAGVVSGVGEGVTDFRPGDRVFGVVPVGAFAERASVPASSLSRVPDGVELSTAAAFGVVYLTAYHALRSVAQVQEGDWVVVLGGAGGVGSAAVELSRVLGARVIAAASSPEKLALCRARGAEHVIDYTTEDLRVRIRQLTGAGADVVLDPVGGRWSEAALRSTRWGGRFVTIGFASGEIPRIPLNLVLLKGVVVKGFEMRTFTQHAPMEAARDRAEVLDLLAAGRIHPHIGATYPLARCADALRLVAERAAVGKVVIEVGPEASG
jgi:NADPH2:quinone reductase